MRLIVETAYSAFKKYFGELFQRRNYMLAEIVAKVLRC